MADFLFHPEAQKEYAAARAWYQERSVRAAARLEAEVERVLEQIGANPEAFPQYDDEQRYALLRRFPYSIVYQVQPSGIYVIALAHGRRVSGYWEGRT